MKVIVLDPGHSLTGDVGSTQHDGGSESTYTLALTKAVRDALVPYECQVVLTHEGPGMVPGGDLADELRARGELPNKLGASLFMSLHHDAGPPGARGGSLYVWTDARAADGGLAWLIAAGNHKAPRSFALAKVMQPIIRDTLAAIGIPWRGAKEQLMCADFAVLRYPNVPCLLLETHFGTNPADDDLMDDPANVARLAQGIARSIVVGLSLAERPKAKDPNAITILYDGVEVSCDAKLVDGSAVAKVRPLAEAMGKGVDYDPRTRTVRLKSR